MKSYTHYLTMHLTTQTGYVNITRDVDQCVRQSGVREGLCLVNIVRPLR